MHALQLQRTKVQKADVDEEVGRLQAVCCSYYMLLWLIVGRRKEPHPTWKGARRARPTVSPTEYGAFAGPGCRVGDAAGNGSWAQTHAHIHVVCKGLDNVQGVWGYVLLQSYVLQQLEKVIIGLLRR